LSDFIRDAFNARDQRTLNAFARCESSAVDAQMSSEAAASVPDIKMHAPLFDTVSDTI
jgi:hypothetical protein